MPMVDTLRIPVGSTPNGGDSAFRNNSVKADQSLLPDAPPTGGLVSGVISGDAPKWDWRSFHPTIGNDWGTTSGSVMFREFIAAYSTSFPATYVSLNRADWTIKLDGRNDSGWESANAAVTGDSSLQSIGTAKVQVLGPSFGRSNSIVYQ
jgi:hypothetical protein